MSNKNSNIKNPPISFWDFLKEYRVIVPIIQRDYAQGRRDKHKLRLEFFGQLISSLINNIPCKLDFVYACPPGEDNPDMANRSDIIYPLDGQQRLTSLWLLYWYIAYKAGILSEDSHRYDKSVSERLKRFSYETRTSSREFCERMCGKLVGSQEGDIKAYISGQPWFTRRFKEDPTVIAMLHSLSDTENMSGFEQLFGVDDIDYLDLWRCLTAKSCPLKFHFRNTKEEGILNSDDLYIKMNARGKKLTDFENFKAELFSYKINQTQELFRGENDDFISKFENSWTNFFWPLRSDDNVVDYLILEFFNRQALNYLILNENLEDKKSLYDYLIKHEPFSKIEIYQPILTESFKSFYANTWNGIIKSGMEGNKWFNKPYAFDYIPVYTSDKKGYQVRYRDSVYYVSPSSVRIQVLTHAASVYFESLYLSDTEFNSLYFSDWMMFSRNLMDNSGLDTYAGIKPLLVFLSSLSSYSLDITSNLESLNYEKIDLPTNTKEQLLEEIQKGNRIKYLRKIQDSSQVEIIRFAEIEYPFDGAIRYLFRNEEGLEDWDNFELKKRHLDGFFDIEHKNEKGFSAIMLRCLYKQIKHWEDMGCPGLNSSYDTWKKILLHNNLRYAVNGMFISGAETEEELAKFISPFSDLIQKGTHEELVRSKFLHQTTWGEFYFKHSEHRAVIWRCSVDWKNYLLGTSRNRLISEGFKKNVIVFPTGIESNRMLGDSEHLWGESFYFDMKHNESQYLFYWRDSEVRRKGRSDKLNCDVYLVRRDNRKYAAHNPNDLGITIEYDCPYDVFIDSLNRLLLMSKDILPQESINV